MLKKIFAVFFAGIFFVMGANAAIDLREECVRENVNFSNYPMGMFADYGIFFDNNESGIPSACTGDVGKLINGLANKKGDIETVLLLGSADSTGSAEYNVELAQKRMSTVNTMLHEQGVPVCEYNESRVLRSRCARLSIGEVIPNALGFNDLSEEYRRAVFMFVIYKNAECTQDVIDALDKLVEKVSDQDVQTELKTAQRYCNTNNKNKMLLQSQYNAIMKAINDAVQKYPDAWEYVPENLSATVLANAIIAIRDSLADGASVWKTEQGEFNYARLASDSIAGVVLGTAGGLITSSVVKKNQIKNGFQDVMCTVGGQNVANWGDEFRVGVR